MSGRALAVFLFLLFCLPGRAEEMAAGISRDKIEINSRFAGTEVAIFGSVQPGIGEIVQGRRARDIVIVVRSDRMSVATVRRKERVGPVWMNRQAQQFPNVPGFYFVASSRPLAAIAAPEVLAQFEIGVARIGARPGAGSGEAPTSFRKALLEARAGADMYSQHEGAVTFMSDSLFRTTLALPPNVPSGNLRVLVYAFDKGRITSSSAMTLYIDKTGIERTLSVFALEQPLAYGLAAVFLSVLAGFAAAMAFRERH